MESKVQLRKPEFVDVAGVQPGARVNIHLKVESVNVTKEIRRYDGTWNRQAECVVGDEKGILDFQATNDQLDVIQPGATITIRNGFAKVMKENGRIKLIVDKWGKVEASTQKVGTVNHSNNISAIEYVLVPANEGGSGGQNRGRGGRRGGSDRRGGRGGQRR